MGVETRVIRPFAGGEVFQRIVDAIRLRCSGEVVDDEYRIELGLDTFLNGHIELELGSADDELLVAGASELGITIADLDLVVVVRAPRLRFSDVVFRSSMVDLRPLTATIDLTRPSRPRALQAPRGGADVEVYICLNRTLAPRPLAPWRLGTWVGHKSFQIRTDLSESGFLPVKLTDADRRRFDLPAGVSHHVALEDVDPFDPEPGPDSLRIYIDEELLDRLAISPSTSMALLIQRQLFLTAVRTIVFAALDRIREEPGLVSRHVDDFEGSNVHRLVSMLAGRGSNSRDLRQDAFRRMHVDPSVFMVEVEAMIGLRKELLELMAESR